MKPIDVLTSLPRSPDIARVVANQGRQGEVQAQGQMLGFSREMNQRNHTVNEAAKTITDNKVDAESPGAGGAGYEFGGGKKDGEAEKENPGIQHPSKGQILDIKGA